MGVSWPATPKFEADEMGESGEGPRSGDEGLGSGEVSSPNSQSLSKPKHLGLFHYPQVYSCILANIKRIGPNSTSGSVKRSELQLMCEKFHIDLIFITESWTSSNDDYGKSTFMVIRSYQKYIKTQKPDEEVEFSSMQKKQSKISIL